MNESLTSTGALECRGVSKSYPSGEGKLEVLRQVNLEVRPGEIVAIVGPSGSGKSTLLQCVGGLDRPDAGEIRVGGRALQSLSVAELARVRNHHIGFVFQFHHLLPDFTALENVMLPCLIAGNDPAKARARAELLLRWVGLEPRAQHVPSQLSGGEQQRIAVARALANGPTAVLADEPSGNLDARTARELHGLLTGLRDREGVTFLIATHDVTLAQRADRILALEDGRLQAVDPGEYVQARMRGHETPVEELSR